MSLCTNPYILVPTLLGEATNVKSYDVDYTGMNFYSDCECMFLLKNFVTSLDVIPSSDIEGHFTVTPLTGPISIATFVPLESENRMDKEAITMSVSFPE